MSLANNSQKYFREESKLTIETLDGDVSSSWEVEHEVAIDFE